MDPFMWMRLNKEVELQAQDIEDGKAWKTFFCNMGGIEACNTRNSSNFLKKKCRKGQMAIE